MMGDYVTAVEIGSSLRMAPDPVFAYHAQNCAGRASDALRGSSSSAVWTRP